MKNLIFIAATMLLASSCAKQENLELVDVITNQGSVEVTINTPIPGPLVIPTITLAPGQRIVQPHEPEYLIGCPTTVGCKVNINGGIVYESKLFKNDYPSKR